MDQGLGKVDTKLALLNKNNYSCWSVEMEIILMHHGCWSFIEGKAIEPDETATYREKTDYEMRKGKAYSLIYFSIEEQYRGLIVNIKDGKSAWDILQKNFEPVTRARIIGLLDEFFSLKYQEGESIGVFGSRIRSVTKKLNDAGHTLNTLYPAFQLIRNLPHRYQSIIQSIYRWDDTKFTIDNIEADLIAEEGRIAQMERDSGSLAQVNIEGAFVSKSDKKSKGKELAANVNTFNQRNRCNYKGSRGNSYGNRGSNRGRTRGDFSHGSTQRGAIPRRGRCYRCNLMGHIAKDCRVVLPKQNRGNASEEDTIGVSFLIETSCNTEYEVQAGKLEWTYDTGATSHFCNDKSLFTDFKEIKEPQTIKQAGKTTTLCITGVGTVSFYVVIDGNHLRTITLKNTYYSEDLRRNLLSGIRVDDAKLGTKIKDGVVTVYSKDWKDVFFQAKRKKNLFVIDVVK